MVCESNSGGFVTILKHDNRDLHEVCGSVSLDEGAVILCRRNEPGDDRLPWWLRHPIRLEMNDVVATSQYRGRRYYLVTRDGEYEETETSGYWRAPVTDLAGYDGLDF